jgi:hypothetical protein
MAMNALQIIQKVVRLMPITELPTTIVGVTDPQVTNLVAILSDCGQGLTTRHDWSTLGKSFSFTSTAENPQREPLPSDWGNAYPNASVWRSGSKLTPLSGPAPPDAWHRLLTLPGVRFPGYWRLFDGNLEVIGCPADETVTFEYVRNGWVVDPDDGSIKSEVTKDGDAFLLPDRLLSLGVMWQWRSAKGLSYAEEMATFEREFELKVAADRAARPISTTWPYRPDQPLRSWPGMIVVGGGTP